MPTAPICVALDLETTGLDSERDAIIEVGAVKFRDDDVLDTFGTFVSPGRTIPPEITDLTGIRDEDVAGAPGVHTVLAELARFVGEAPIVGHSVDFDLAFLRRLSHEFRNESLDTFELAGVLLPHADRYSLSELTNSLEIDLDQPHRALFDAGATHRLFRALFQRCMALPPRVLTEIVRYGERVHWPAVRFFRDALAEAAHHAELARPDGAGAIRQPDEPAPLFAADYGPLQPAAEPHLLDEGVLSSLLEQDGALASQFPEYEHRPQQVAMLRRVAQAFNRGEHLLVEAPTGVGKSLAYLIPAVYWATHNGDRVVISTNTINLQEQLYRKDLPELAGILPFPFRATVLKGRSHYLCPARFEALRRRGAASLHEARVLAKVLVWRLDTESGDGDELFLPSADDQAAWQQLSAENEGCTPDRCAAFQRNTCYYYRARRAAEASHLVIVNHALLLADVAVENRALPEYRHLVVDEAHHLEAATTSGLSFTMDRAGLRRMLSQIGSIAPNGRVSGLLATLLAACEQAKFGSEIIGRLELAVAKLAMAVDRAARTLDGLFDSLGQFVREQDEVRHSQYELRLRVTSGLRVQPAWEAVEIGWDDANVPLRAVVTGLQRLADALEELSSVRDFGEGSDLRSQLLGIARTLADAQAHLNQMLTQPSPSYVYWLTIDGRSDDISLHAAPLHVGPLVEEHLFLKKRAVVMTSATLRTGSTFDFIRERLNAWDADELAVGSPFNFEDSTLVYLIDDIPEPERPGYQQALQQGMAALFRATEGRALALFTSYSQLRATLRGIKAPLTQAGITVQAQGEGISRRQLLENFRSGERRVLLGTRSFWEGVDVPGQALSCLAIAKLPFSVPTDPIFAARSETFDQPFLDYAVPETILRFLQGFGRLIRSRTDRGVVAVFDSRLLTKSYGELFLESLPGPTVRRGPMAQLPRAASEWLRAGGAKG
ncbi:MAG: DEAD/DEAH box helicase [Anaerolineales bacterium]|nr:DEAD/DEAH box helicase [Anaerolineales bacterium]